MSSLLSLVLLVFLVFRRISVFQFKSESFFSLKPSAPQGEIIPQNFSSLGFAVSEELGNKQTDNSLISYCFLKWFVSSRRDMWRARRRWVVKTYNCLEFCNYYFSLLKNWGRETVFTSHLRCRVKMLKETMI